MADRTIQIKIGMQELAPSEMADLFCSLNNDLHEIEFELDETESKSPAQRLRNVLYKLWEKNHKEKYTEFEVYYRAKMENLINRIKDKLQ